MWQSVEAGSNTGNVCRVKIGKKQFVSSSERGVQQGSVWSPILLLINGPSSMPACKVKFGHLCEQFLATLVVPYMPMTFVYTLPAAFSLWKHRSPWCKKMQITIS